jgi:hypothetical protein
LLEILAIGLIGEGVAGLLTPRRYMRLWEFGPQAYRDALDWFVARPHLTRLLCAVEIGLGVCLTLRETGSSKADDVAVKG